MYRKLTNFYIAAVFDNSRLNISYILPSWLNLLDGREVSFCFKKFMYILNKKIDSYLLLLTYCFFNNASLSTQTLNAFKLIFLPQMGETHKRYYLKAGRLYNHNIACTQSY